MQCNENSATCETIGTDGSGISDADFILYVSANEVDPCGPTSSTLAFAGACQLEAILDRYNSTLC